MKVVLNAASGIPRLSAEATRRLIDAGSVLVTRRACPNTGEWNPERQRILMEETSFGMLLYGDEVVSVPLPRELAVRAHPDLIHVVERLGGHASARGTQLVVVDAPEGAHVTLVPEFGGERLVVAAAPTSGGFAR